MLDTVLIVGLGLMGSNLGLKLRSQGVKVYGKDRNKKAYTKALNSAVIDEGTPEEVDLIILSMPINEIINYFNTPQVEISAKATVDLGGTKKDICKLMNESVIPAIGGHPLCGVADNNDFKYNIDLYSNSTFILSETSSTTEEAKLLVLEMVKLVNANPVWLEPSIHDEIIAITSHIPHLISTALIGSVMEHYELEEIMEFTSGGFDGATRLSRTNPDMIWGMLETNNEFIRIFGEKFLNEFQNIFSMNGENDLYQYIEGTVEWRRELANRFGERSLE